MEKIKITKETEFYINECKICEFKTYGVSKAQADSRMRMHQTSKSCQKIKSLLNTNREVKK